MKLLSANQAQRMMEKEAVKHMTAKEKFFYFATSKRTWFAVGGIITAVAQSDYETGFKIALGWIF